MILGIFLFPPFGMVLGLIIGAVVGELLAGKKAFEAMKIGAVTFLASLAMILVKLAVSGVLTYYYIDKAISELF
jgi:hypothetical protein